MELEPILREAMLTPGELPGWSSIAVEDSVEASPFASAGYGDRFVSEATVRLAREDTGEILVQHVGVLNEHDAVELENDLSAPVTTWPSGEILSECATEAWAVCPLPVPDLGDQSVGFRLIAGLSDERPLLADNVYIRRGRVASALVRLGRLGGEPSSQGVAPLAELADRKLAMAAEKIGQP